MTLRVAVLSVHTCPLAVLGGKDTGGMNVYVRELSRELGRLGVSADIFTRSQNPSIPRVVRLGEGVRVVHLRAGPETPLPRARLQEHLEEFADAVEAWRLAREADYGLVHAHYWLSGLVGLTLRERWNVPMIQMFHTLGRLKNGAAGSRDEREPPARLLAEERLVVEADRLVAANVAERAQLLRHHGADPARIAVVPCGVDTTLFTPGDADAARARLGLDDTPAVLYVGRLAPIKGLATLLDAVALLRADGGRVRLLVVGGDADEPANGHEAELRARAARLALGDAVRFVGPQAQERLPDYYVAAAATVLPSYYESFGMVALEAMACGSPVIATRVGGLPTTVRDGVTGLLVADRDAAALARAIERVLRDQALRRRLGREGVRWASRHRWPCVAEAICREYAALEPAALAHLTTAADCER